jgi:hypothetical protein
MENQEKHIKHADIEWEIKTRSEKEHGNVFYITTLSATLLFLFFSIWQKDFLFGVFVILASGTVLFLSTQRPDTYKFKLTDDALVIGNNESVYPYNRFSHFHIYEYSPEEHELFLVFKERFHPILRIRVYRRDIEKIKEFLSGYLPEKDTDPSIMDIFSKIVGI